jgi:hypothetical protein
MAESLLVPAELIDQEARAGREHAPGAPRADSDVFVPWTSRGPWTVLRWISRPGWRRAWSRSAGAGFRGWGSSARALVAAGGSRLRRRRVAVTPRRGPGGPRSAVHLAAGLAGVSLIAVAIAVVLEPGGASVSRPSSQRSHLSAGVDRGPADPLMSDARSEVLAAVAARRAHPTGAGGSENRASARHRSHRGPASRSAGTEATTVAVNYVPPVNGTEVGTEGSSGPSSNGGAQPVSQSSTPTSSGSQTATGSGGSGGSGSTSGISGGTGSGSTSGGAHSKSSGPTGPYAQFGPGY